MFKPRDMGVALRGPSAASGDVTLRKRDREKFDEKRVREVGL
jgi:hypothetical protein